MFICRIGQTSKLDGIIAPHNSHTREGRTVLFGNAPSVDGALRATFDGWIVKVGPVSAVDRLQERLGGIRCILLQP